MDDQAVILDTKEGDKFTFDFVANEDKSQDDVFKKIGKPIVDSCI